MINVCVLSQKNTIIYRLEMASLLIRRLCAEHTPAWGGSDNYVSWKF